MKKFKYTGLNPCNIMFDGISFPVSPGDVVFGEETFLKNAIPESKLKEVSLEVTAKYRFPKGKNIFRKDPTGGLPVKSQEGRPKTDKAEPYSPATAVEEVINPYDLSDRHKKLEVTTQTTQPGLEVHTPVDPEEISEETVEVDVLAEDDVEVPKEKITVATEKVSEAAPSTDPKVPSKTALRKELKAALVGRTKKAVGEGCPLNPELLDDMSAITDDSHKGPVLELLMQYYGME